jgi:toxin ParE1/3/4
LQWQSAPARKPDVRRDLVELADHISRDNLDAALRFLDAAERTFNFLAANNQCGQLCDFQQLEIAGLRVWPIEGFRNYLVFYRPTDEGVDIWRVLHGARDIESLFGVGR